MSQNVPQTVLYLGEILDRIPNITDWVIATVDGLLLASKDTIGSNQINEDAARIATLSNIAEQIIGLFHVQEPYLYVAPVPSLEHEEQAKTKTSSNDFVLVTLWNEYTLFFTIMAPESSKDDRVKEINRTVFQILSKFIQKFPMESASTELKVDLVKAIPFILKNIRNDSSLLSKGMMLSRYLADSKDFTVKECLANHLKSYLLSGIPADVIVEIANKLEISVPDF